MVTSSSQGVDAQGPPRAAPHELLATLAAEAADLLGQTAALAPAATGYNAACAASPTSGPSVPGNVDPAFARPTKLDRDMALAWKAIAAARRVLALARSVPDLRPAGWPDQDSDAAIRLTRCDHALVRAADPDVDSMILRPGLLCDAARTQELSMVLFVASRRPPQCDYDESAATSGRDPVGLWDLEGDILRHLVRNTSVHLYVVVPLPGDTRNYANLVLGRPLATEDPAVAPPTPSGVATFEPIISVMDSCQPHSDTVATTAPRAYRWVTIHSGLCLGLNMGVTTTMSCASDACAPVPTVADVLKELEASSEEHRDDASAATAGVFCFMRTKCIDYGSLMPPPPPAPCLRWRRRGVLPRSDVYPCFQRTPMSLLVDHDEPTAKTGRTLADGAEAYDALRIAEAGAGATDGPTNAPTFPGSDDAAVGGGKSGDNLDGLDVDRAAPLPCPPHLLRARAERGPIRVSSCQGHNSQAFYREEVFPAIARMTGLPLVWVDPEPLWTRGSFEALTSVEDPLVDVVFMCGVEFGRHYFEPQSFVTTPVSHIALPATGKALLAEPLAAPSVDYSRLETLGFDAASNETTVGQRYLRAREDNLGLLRGAEHDEKFEDVDHRPGDDDDFATAWYTSVIVVAADRRDDFPTFESLRGKQFAFNEPLSWSGYLLLKLALTGSGFTPETYFDGFFSGSHQASMEAVREGRADAALIDAALLVAEFGHPELATSARKLHIVRTPWLGSARWPMPPVVGSKQRLTPWERGAIQRAFATMHLEVHSTSTTTQKPVVPSEPQGIRRFVAVGSAPYRVQAAAVQQMMTDKGSTAA